MAHPDHILIDAAQLVTPLSTDPNCWISVEVNFESQPPRVHVCLVPAHRGLRDRKLDMPLPGWEVHHEELRNAFARYADLTRTAESWYLAITLTVYVDGLFSFGSTRHAPRPLSH